MAPRKKRLARLIAGSKHIRSRECRGFVWQLCVRTTVSLPPGGMCGRGDGTRASMDLSGFYVVRVATAFSLGKDFCVNVLKAWNDLSLSKHRVLEGTNASG